MCNPQSIAGTPLRIAPRIWDSSSSPRRKGGYWGGCAGGIAPSKASHSSHPSHCAPSTKAPADAAPAPTNLAPALADAALPLVDAAPARADLAPALANAAPAPADAAIVCKYSSISNFLLLVVFGTTRRCLYPLAIHSYDD